MLKIMEDNVITKFKCNSGTMPIAYESAIYHGLHQLLFTVQQMDHVITNYKSIRWKNGCTSHCMKLRSDQTVVTLNIANITNDIKFSILRIGSMETIRKIIYQWMTPSRAVIESILSINSNNINEVLRNYTIDHSKYVDLYEPYIKKNPKSICRLPRSLHTKELIRYILDQDISTFPYISSKLQTKEDAVKYIHHIISKRNYRRDWSLDICARLRRDQDIMLMEKLK